MLMLLFLQGSSDHASVNSAHIAAVWHYAGPAAETLFRGQITGTKQSPRVPDWNHDDSMTATSSLQQSGPHGSEKDDDSVRRVNPGPAKTPPSRRPDSVSRNVRSARRGCGRAACRNRAGWHRGG